MNKLLLISFLICSISVSTLNAQTSIEKNFETFDAFLSHQKLNLDKIKVGMTISEVAEIMGPNMVVIVPKIGRMKALKQLFRQPQFVNEYQKTMPNRRTIYWFFSDPVDQNGVISKRECTPVIFRTDSVIGQGWEFFKEFRLNGMK